MQKAQQEQKKCLMSVPTSLLSSFPEHAPAFVLSVFPQRVQKESIPSHKRSVTVEERARKRALHLSSHTGLMIVESPTSFFLTP